MNGSIKKEQKKFLLFLKMKPEPHHRILPGEEVSQGGNNIMRKN